MKIERNSFGYHPEVTEYYPDEMLNDLNEIYSLTNDAFSWFIGQFIKSVLKPNQNTTEYVKKKRTEIMIKKPFLG